MRDGRALEENAAAPDRRPEGAAGDGEDRRGMSDGLTVAGEILRRTARRLGSKTALVDGDRRVDYARFDREANRLANALIAAGIASGDPIAIMSANRLEYAYVFYGAARAGAVLGNLSVRYTENDVAEILALSEARLVLVDRERLDRVLAVRDRLPELRRVVLLDPGGGSLPDGVEAYEAFVADRPTAEPGRAVGPHDPLAVTYTGGTTGRPKGVLVSHHARAMSALTAIVEYDLAEDDTAVVATPLFHAAGLFVWFHPAVMIGATVVLMESWDPEAFMRIVEEEKATAVLLIPTQINGLLRAPGFDPARLRTLRKINHAGMIIPVALIEQVLDAMPWAELTNNYGTSETGPLTVRRASDLPEKAHSVGRPVFNVEVEIRDRDGRPLPPGEIGEIVTRGDHLLTRYVGAPEETAELFRSDDGWLWTGDLGAMDPDGYITLVDRSKEIIIAGGENIYPTEIENALYRHPAVAECAAFGIPDDHWGEVPAAHVVLRDGVRATAEELSDFCATQIPRHKRPRLVKFVDALPKTAVGKIQRHKIRAEYWAARNSG